MVTTRFDFIHPFRSTAGLARQVKWTSFVEKWRRNSYLRVESTWKPRIEEAIKNGVIEEVIDIFNEVLKIERIEEKRLAVIMKDEQILLFEEKKKDKLEMDASYQLMQICNELEKNQTLGGTIGREIQARAEGLNIKVEKFHYHMQQVEGAARTILDQLRANYKGLISAKTAKIITTERGRFKENVKLAREQVSQIKKENMDSTMTDVELKQLWYDLAVLRKSKGKLDNPASTKAAKDITSRLDTLFKYQEDLFANLLKEADEYLQILENTVHAYIEIYDDAMNNIPAVVNVLKDQGFPDDKLVVLEKTAKEFFGIVQDHVQNVYRFAAYNQNNK